MSTKITMNLKASDLEGIATPLLVLSYTQEQIQALKKENASNTEDKIISTLSSLFQSGDFKGKKGEVFVHNLIDSQNKNQNQKKAKTTFHIERLCLLGLGEEQKLMLENIRKTYWNAVRTARKLQLTQFMISAHDHLSFSQDDFVLAVSEASLLANYEWDKYKTQDKDSPKLVKEVTVLVAQNTKETEIVNLKKKIREAELVCEQSLFVRDCINENAEVMNPLMLEKLSRESAKRFKLKITVFDEKILRKHNMNLILGVAKGSSYPPRMIFLEYNGNKKSKEKVALVGKGITFDTGGLNLKPTKYIETMKCDMGGAATVLGIIRAAAAMKLPVNLVAVLSCAENAIGSKAQKPGDVVKGYNGTFVEITNTDAEGRLVLADALAYTEEKYKPTKIIDMATLTGSVMVSFGSAAAGLMSTDETMVKDLFEAGKATGEKVWELPLYEEYESLLKSEIADTVSCVVSPYVGAITAALFLKKFVKTDSWAHLDIAGTAFLDKVGGNQPLKGASGFGVRLVIEYLRKKR